MVKTTILFICDQLLGALIHLNFIILILICFLLMMPGVNYLIYGCSSARNGVITQDGAINENFKNKRKTELCVRVDYSY